MSLRNVLAAASIVIASFAFPACSNQAEGERCDVNNNDDDCQEGLICTSSRELGGSADYCCPPGQGTSELPECTLGGGLTGTGTGSAVSTGAAVGSSASSASVSASSSSGGGDGGAGGGTGGASSQGGAGGN